MKRKLNIITSVVYILLSLFIVTAGLFVTDSLPPKLTVKLNEVFDGLDLPSDSVDVINSLSAEVLSQDESGEMPHRLYGVYLNLNTDFTRGTDELIAEYNEYFDYFKNFHCDTVFVKPDTKGDYLGLTDGNGNALDALRCVLNRAQEDGYTQILWADETLLYNPNGEFTCDNIIYYLSNYSFGGVLLQEDAFSSAELLCSALSTLRTTLLQQDINVFLGLEASENGGNPNSAALQNALQEKLLDFVIVISSQSTLNSPSFSKVLKSWNSFAGQYPETRFYCLHNTALVCSGKAGWGSYTEIADQMQIIWDCENISGSIYSDALALKTNKSQSAGRIAWLLDDGSSSELTIKSVSLDSESNTVTFTGYAASGHRLYCNNIMIQENGGSFIKRFSLSVGSNSFTFFSYGKDITYRVYNNAHIIHSCYPSGDINADKNETITVMAACMSGSNVVCTLNGNTYPMTVREDIVLEGIPEGYDVYVCQIAFSKSSFRDISLGKLRIAAVLGDNKEAVTGGRVTLLKSNSSPFINRLLNIVYSILYNNKTAQNEYTDYTEYEDEISPYRDNGLGTSLMCRIWYDETEVLGQAGEYNTYHADNSTLCEGTLDYVENMSVSEGGYIRYDLKSGISVYGVNCELINNAFTLPKNRCIVRQVDDTGANTTDIILKNDWLVPITVQASPQGYYVGYQNYYYNVRQLTCEYVDVVIHYSDLYNSNNLLFDNASPFSHTEVYSNGSDGVILRLYLKQTGQFYGFKIYRNEKGETVLSFKKHSDASVAGKVIMLDPGHGGLSMTGTAVQSANVPEKKVTLAIALKVKSILEGMGATVIMTRQTDIPLTLEDRWELFAEANPDLYLSIHCDGSEYTGDSGTHTFYFRPYSQPLAKAIHESLVAAYRNYIYSPSDANYTSVDRGIKYYPFYVTRLNDCPSVLIETGFMTNPTEGLILLDSTCQANIAAGIANGVVNYFAQNH